MKKRLVCLGVSACLILSSTLSFAANAPYSLPKDLDTGTGEETEMTLTVSEAVAYGLDHSTVLSIVDNKVQLALLQQEATGDKAEALEDAEDSYEASKAYLAVKYSVISDLQDDLDAANAALDAGYAPDDVPVLIEEYGLAMTIGAGENIRTALDVYLDDPILTGVTAAVVSGVEDELEDLQDELDTNKAVLNSLEDLMDNFYDKVLSDVTAEIEDMIDFNSTVVLEVEDLTELMLKMASVNVNVTAYAEDIYRNQVAMLIMKNYYDCLYLEKMVEVNDLTMQRGKAQYEMSKLSYENGMKAKDDYLLAKMYYEGTVMTHRLSQADYANALYELKESINCNMTCDLTLIDELDVQVGEPSLSAALTSGLKKRLEVQQATGQMRLALMNYEIIQDEYDDDDYEYEEAYTLYKNSMDTIALAQNTIRSEIYQSYELVEATGDMMEESQYLIQAAEEVLTIAQLKYEEGFGADNSLLTNLNLQGSSATMLELIAAQENLAKIESQVAQVRYNHTMARIKFLNDAGIMTY